MSTAALRLCLLGIFLSSAAPIASASTLVSDDFSADSGRWTYAGMAYRDAARGHVVLTNATGWTYGQLWLDVGRTAPFKATFRYWIGGGSGADGIVFMFHKQTGYAPDVGGTLGFTLPPHGSLWPVPGYGVEIDGWYNPGWDPSPSHIALIQDRSDRNLAWASDPRTKDSTWHTVEVRVEEAAVTVSVDGAELFHWSGEIDRTFSGIGFSAATGAATNWHLVDDVRIEDLAVTVGVDVKPEDENNTFNNDGSGVLPVAILGSAEFDVTTVDASTVTLQSLPVKLNGQGRPLAHLEDVNGDGYVDLLLQISDEAVVFGPGESIATLEGELLDGTPIVGTDRVRIVPRG